MYFHNFVYVDLATTSLLSVISLSSLPMITSTLTVNATIMTPTITGMELCNTILSTYVFI